MSFSDPVVHVRVMGANGSGKTTIVSTVVSRTLERRSFPYQRTRVNQRFATTIKAGKGQPALFEIMDTVADDAIQSVNKGEVTDERTSLLHHSNHVDWCYLIMFDFTRHETYLQAKSLIDQIRLKEKQAIGRGHQIHAAIVFLVGNKRDIHVIPSVLAWTKDMKKYSNEKDLFAFSGSVFDNSFELLDADKRDFVKSSLVLTPSSEEQLRLNVEQLFYLFRCKVEYDSGFYRRRAFFGRDNKEEIFDPEKGKESSSEDEISLRNCCWRCCFRKRE